MVHLVININGCNRYLNVGCQCMVIIATGNGYMVEIFISVTPNTCFMAETCCKMLQLAF